MNEEKNINQLPKDWKLVKLSEVVTEIKPGYPTGKHNTTGDGFLHFRPYNIDCKGNVELSQKKYVPLKSDNYFLKHGDIIFNNTNSLELLGKTCYINNPENWVYSNHMTRIRVNEDILSKYCATYLHFLFYKGYYQANCSNHVNQASISSSFLSKFLELPLPPKPTQQAIVSKIEELCSELDKGIENLRLAQQQLKTYRQSVLKWAFEGKLTNENVKEGELPKGWTEVQIKDVAETYGGYAFKSGEFKTKGKYQVLRMGNVRPGVLRYEESPVFLDVVDENVLNRSLLRINDIIITQTGTRKKRDYGFTVLIQKGNLLLNQRIAAIRFKEKYLPKFFLYFSWTDLFKDQFFSNETGNVGQGNVGMKGITETLIPFCSIAEQNKIIQEIESRLSVADKMEESITQSLQQAEALRQSILKKAFEGSLV